MRTWLERYFRAHVIKVAGVEIPLRSALNFIGATFEDNPDDDTVDIVLSGGGGPVLSGPEVLGIFPTLGAPEGGTFVEIEVDDSTGATGATVGGVALTSFVIIDATHVGGFTGAHAPSSPPVDVTVTNPNGTGTLVQGYTFAYDSLVWATRQASAPWVARDGAMAIHFGGKYWMLGGWNPTDPAFPPSPLPTTNEVWSSSDGVTWTLELAHDTSPPTSGPGARWKRRHFFGCFEHRHSGVDYIYVLGGDHLSSSDGDFSAAPSNGYQCDVWRSPNGTVWERVAASGTPTWSGRMLAIFGSSPGKLWCFGGQNGLLSELAGACVLHNDLHVSTDGGATWTQVLADAAPSSTRPAPRGIVDHLIYWRGRMWLVSGGTYDTAANANRQYFREVWSFDPDNAGAGWTQHAAPPWLGVEYQTVRLFRGELFLLQGYTGDGYSGGSSGANTRLVWSSKDGERWRRHETPPWVHTHAMGMAVKSDGSELLAVAGNGDLTTAPSPPGVARAYALVATPFYAATTVPTPRQKWRVADAVLSGANIQSIPDSSGNGSADLVFGNASGDAVYIASEPEFGGAPAAESDGGYFLKTNAPIDLSSFTIFIVGKFAQTSGSFYSFYALTTGPVEYAYEFGDIDGVIADRVGRSIAVLRGGVTLAGSATTIFDNDETGHVYATTYDGTAAGSDHRLDGAHVVPNDSGNTGDPGTAAWSAVLNILCDNTGTGSKAGKVAEIRVYPPLTLAQKQAVEAELRALYPYAI